MALPSSATTPTCPPPWYKPDFTGKSWISTATPAGHTTASAIKTGDTAAAAAPPPRPSDIPASAGWSVTLIRCEEMTDISLTTIAVPIDVKLQPLARSSIESACSKLDRKHIALIFAAYGGLPPAAFDGGSLGSIARTCRSVILAEQQIAEHLVSLSYITGLPIASIRDEMRCYPGTLLQFESEIMTGGRLYRRLRRLAEILKDNPIEIEVL